MSCNNAPTLKFNEATRDTTKSLIALIIKNMGTIPSGNKKTKKVHVHMVKDLDFYEQEIPTQKSNIQGEDEKVDLPAIVISLPQLHKPNRAYIDTTSRRIENDYEDTESGLMYGFVYQSSVYLNHNHRMKLIADNIIDLQVMMRRFVNMFQTGAMVISVEDKLNGIISSREISVDRWPDAYSGRPNNQGYYDAEAGIIIEGVEYMSEKYERHHVITDFKLVVIGVDQTVNVKVAQDGEVIINID